MQSDVNKQKTALDFLKSVDWSKVSDGDSDELECPHSTSKANVSFRDAIINSGQVTVNTLIHTATTYNIVRELVEKDIVGQAFERLMDAERARS